MQETTSNNFILVKRVLFILGKLEGYSVSDKSSNN
jgi:hypothetical protein